MLKSNLLSSIYHLAIVVLIVFGICAFSSSSFAQDKASSEMTAQSSETNDPLEPLNRTIFGLNELLDIMIINPAATIYKGIVPDFARHMVSNVLYELSSPVILANTLLQGDWDNAENTTKRVLVNTTLGIGGLLDVASDLNIPYVEEDFGQTLGVWGVDPGFYLVLPIIGPSNLRDASGRLVDSLIDPVDRYALNTDRTWIPVTRTIATTLDTRLRLDETIKDIHENSLDPYTTYRSWYSQSRNAAIRGQSDSSVDIPDESNE